MTRVHSWIKLLSTWCVGLLCALAFGQALATSGAVSTTDNVNWPDTNVPLPMPIRVALAEVAELSSGSRTDCVDAQVEQQDAWAVSLNSF